jgi:hypothetical protein
VESHLPQRDGRLSENFTAIAILAPPIIAGISLLVWTAAVIYYIDTA